MFIGFNILFISAIRISVKKLYPYLSGMISVCLSISQSVSHDVKLWCA